MIQVMEEYLRILQRHGKGREDDLYEYSLKNALALAEGRLPLVVVLQEPCNTADTVPYDTMVYGNESIEEWGPERVGSATLQELEDLIENTSMGRYGLEDVSVFDLNTLLSRDIQNDVGDRVDDLLAEAHNTFWEMLLAKKPRVIVVLTTTAGKSSDSRVTLLGSSLFRAGSTREIILHNGEIAHKTLIVRGFHPSIYLRDDYVSANDWDSRDVRMANDMLMCCFQMAFDEIDACERDEAAHKEQQAKWKELLHRPQKQRRLDLVESFHHLSLN